MAEDAVDTLLAAWSLRQAAELVEMAVLEGCGMAESVEEAIRGFPREDFCYLGWWVFGGGRECHRVERGEGWP